MGLDQPGAVALDELAVDGDLAARTEVFDHVPVDGALVLAARVGVARADREVHGAGDLLVEEDVAREARDPRVAAEPELAEAARARVGREDLAQELLALLGGGSFLRAMLPRLEEGPGVQVFIGQENPADELRRLGVVVSTYGVDGEVVGVLGVVGPTRMAYDRSISSVRYMARLMSDLMADLRG